MSQRALLLAVRDYLRQQMQLTDAECDILYDGQPPPDCGERFIAVHAGEWRGGDVEARDDTFGVNVTVTRRTSYAPADRVVSPLTGPDFLALDKTLDQVASLLHKDPAAAGSGTAYPVLALANATIGSAANGFVEPLTFRDGGRPEPKGSDWFSAEPGQGVCGISQTLSFSGARRIQTNESQT
jgi:hypothetical protein